MITFQSTRALLIACAAVFMTSAHLPAADNLAPSEADKSFFRELKRAVMANDHAWITAHVCLPVKARINGHARLIVTADEFKAHYTDIVTIEVVRAVREQTADSLQKTKQGIMIGDGQLWFDETGDPDPITGKPVECITAFGT